MALRRSGFDEELRRTAYWVALLRYVGCTGHAHEVASVFGDDIAILAQTLVMDAADPADVGRTMVASATAGHPPEEHAEIVRALQAGAHDWAVHNFATGCEVGDMLIQRLDLGPDVRTAFGFTYERWNGNGYPTHAKGEQIPLAMRVVHLTHDMEAIGRRSSPAEAIAAARERRDRTYDPDLADLFVAHGSRWFDQVDGMEPWEAVLDLEPEPRRTLEGAGLDAALTVAADFIDLKSPCMGPAMAAIVRSWPWTPPGCTVPPSRRSARCAGRPWYMSSAPRRSGTPSPGQAGSPHARRVRSHRTPPDAHRADAGPLAAPSRLLERGGGCTPRGRPTGGPITRAYRVTRRIGWRASSQPRTCTSASQPTGATRLSVHGRRGRRSP